MRTSHRPFPRDGHNCHMDLLGGAANGGPRGMWRRKVRPGIRFARKAVSTMFFFSKTPEAGPINPRMALMSVFLRRSRAPPSSVKILFTVKMRLLVTLRRCRTSCVLLPRTGTFLYGGSLAVPTSVDTDFSKPSTRFIVCSAEDSSIGSATRSASVIIACSGVRVALLGNFLNGGPCYSAVFFSTPPGCIHHGHPTRVFTTFFLILILFIFIGCLVPLTKPEHIVGVMTNWTSLGPFQRPAQPTAAETCTKDTRSPSVFSSHHVFNRMTRALCTNRKVSGSRGPRLTAELRTEFLTRSSMCV